MASSIAFHRAPGDALATITAPEGERRGVAAGRASVSTVAVQSALLLDATSDCDMTCAGILSTTPGKKEAIR
ncbi:hypothetical protein ACFVKC_01595 [Streptomyces noursei]|uniref:hypothetical protein n=1 Tax=Streptomyces noursei TaxID=1971 RepID=UPI0036453967